MGSPPKDNFGNWCKFILGGFFFCVGAVELFQFVAYGEASLGPYSKMPIHLTGENAALAYVLYLTLGALTCVSGMKGLLSR